MLRDRILETDNSVSNRDGFIVFWIQYLETDFNLSVTDKFRLQSEMEYKIRL
jgi:hypothetical protein